MSKRFIGENTYKGKMGKESEGTGRAVSLWDSSNSHVRKRKEDKFGLEIYLIAMQF